MIHFARHGVSDNQCPSDSHLLVLSDNPLESAALSVGAISNLNIENAQVAFLSACCTADNAAMALMDESIYIASGFQLAGFSHVLATQWESSDECCRCVSVEFYRSLFHAPMGRDKGHRAVSVAFHCAVKQLRSTMWGQPIKWAPFIHTGA